MEDVSVLQKPPFDNVKFIKLFDKNTTMGILNSINNIKENAVNVIA
ncbi:MAG: hypothetical protein IJS61_06345 [Firmicutes bacterium]|nr:hypothetical protein [Bacillota bacterium]